MLFSMSKRRKRAPETVVGPKVVGPGITAMQVGKLGVVRSNRSPEEQAEVNRHVQGFRDSFQSSLAEKVAQVEQLMAQFNSFDLLANLSVVELSRNPETHKESDEGYENAVVEYGTLLCLKGPFRSQSVSQLSPRAYQQIRDALTSAVAETLIFYSTEGVGTNAVTDPLRNLRIETITDELLVRCPGYPQHIREILQSLFGNYDSFFLANVGFTVTDLLKIDAAVTSLVNRKFNDARDRAKEEEREVLESLRGFRESQSLQNADLEPLLKRLSPLSQRHARRAMDGIYAAMFFAHLGQVVSFTAEEVANEAGLNPSRVSAALSGFSLNFGEVPPDFTMPSPIHPLKQKPFVHHEGRFLCPTRKLFLWAIKPLLEGILKRDGPTWNKYARSRAAYLEQESLRLFNSAMPRAKA
jgi:hypothetical protein